MSNHCFRLRARRRVFFVLSLVTGLLLFLNATVETDWEVYMRSRSASDDLFSLLIDCKQRNISDILEKDEERRKLLANLDSLPWYMKNGTKRPTAVEYWRKKPNLYPDEAPKEDRIPDQLMFLPPQEVDTSVHLKTILLWNGVSSWKGLELGRKDFLKQECPVSSCKITAIKREAKEADLILFKGYFSLPTHKRTAQQLWMIYMLECPNPTQTFLWNYTSVFNWTATYRSDSTIVTPYERWHYYHPNITNILQRKNYAANKSKQVAWFVSNCDARNNRLQYAKQLAKYINVDIYGRCGDLKCHRRDQRKCFEMLTTDYKFYLAFENYNCQDYITEKFFINGLGHNVLPIVMGARPEDYKRSAPQNSYIHVDQFSGPKELATYLHILDNNDDLYNSYFQWKGTGELINTNFWCRVCGLLHGTQAENTTVRYIEDINSWWTGQALSGFDILGGNNNSS